MQSQSSHSSEREFISLLIDLYRDSPELWNVKSKGYFNKNERSTAFYKILKALKTLKPDYTIIDLKKKINVLRTNFNREYKSIKKQRGSTDIIPKPSLWYYNELYFIKDQIEGTPNETLEQPLSDEDTHSPKQILLPPIKKKKPQPDSSEQLVGLVTEYFKRPETEEDILAKGWAMKLKRLLPDQKLYAEKIINDTLFEAELGNLTREGMRWSPSPPSSLSPSNSQSLNLHRYLKTEQLDPS